MSNIAPSDLPHADVQRIAVGCAVITVSDTRTQAEDTSGHLIQTALMEAGHRVVDYQILPDEPAVIQNQLQAWGVGRQNTATDPVSDSVQAIILNGGTGIAPRDTTYDAISQLLEKELPGFGEIFRALSYAEIGSRAIASRATAGIYRQRLVFSLPGSPKAVTLAMEKLILPELVHLTHLLKTTS